MLSRASQLPYNVKIKNVENVIEGDILDGGEFKRIASLPSKEELLAKLAMMLNSPLSKLVWALKSPLSDVTNLLSNVKEKESKKN